MLFSFCLRALFVDAPHEFTPLGFCVLSRIADFDFLADRSEPRFLPKAGMNLRCRSLRQVIQEREGPAGV